MKHLTVSPWNDTPLRHCSRRTFLKGAALAGTVMAFPSLITGCGSSSGDVPLEQKIAQMLMVGFRGLTLDNSNYIVRDIRDYRIGGTILFDRDAKLKTYGRNIVSPEQLQGLTASCVNSPPLRSLSRLIRKAEM